MRHGAELELLDLIKSSLDSRDKCLAALAAYKFRHGVRPCCIHVDVELCQMINISWISDRQSQ